MESPAQKANLVSWSAVVRYAIISAINLAILLVGMALGVMLAPHIERSVSAHPAQTQVAQPQATPVPAAPETQYEDVTPISRLAV
jgi:hypothetical protein